MSAIALAACCCGDDSPSGVCPAASALATPRCFPECTSNTYRVAVAGLTVDWCTGEPNPEESECGTGTATVDLQYGGVLGECGVEEIAGGSQTLWPPPAGDAVIALGGCRVDYVCQARGEAWYRLAITVNLRDDLGLGIPCNRGAQIGSRGVTIFAFRPVPSNQDVVCLPLGVWAVSGWGGDFYSFTSCGDPFQVRNCEPGDSYTTWNIPLPPTVTVTELP